MPKIIFTSRWGKKAKEVGLPPACNLSSEGLPSAYEAWPNPIHSRETTSQTGPASSTSNHVKGQGTSLQTACRSMAIHSHRESCQSLFSRRYLLLQFQISSTAVSDIFYWKVSTTSTAEKHIVLAGHIRSGFAGRRRMTGRTERTVVDARATSGTELLQGSFQRLHQRHARSCRI